VYDAVTLLRNCCSCCSCCV